MVTANLRQGGGQNILIITGARMGDFVVSMPTIREIRRVYPKAHISLIINAHALKIAEMCPYVDELIFRQHAGDMAPFSTDLMILPQLLERNFNIAFSTRNIASFPLLMYLSGAQARITRGGYSYNIKKGTLRGESLKLATKVVPNFKYGLHEVDCNLSLLDDILLIPVANRELELWHNIADFQMAKSVVKNLSHPLYALMMGASSPRRRYPTEKFVMLVKMILSTEPTATFINFGGGKADEISAQILYQQLGEEVFNKHIINLVGKSNFRIDAEIMKFCDMYIGNNTGNMLLASAAKCPVLVAECFPNDLGAKYYDIPKFLGSYKVPTVSVQPKHALPECAVNNPHIAYGCRVTDKPHSIT